LETTLIYIMLLCHLAFPIAPEDAPKQVMEVPVFKLNFYMMGMEEVDQSITVQIGSNIDYINQEFEGKIKFELGDLVLDQQHEYIPDLHTSYVKGETEYVDDMVAPIEKGRAIQVFLFNTYSKSEDHGAMLGFTPVLAAGHKDYHQLSPSFDRVYISYPGITDMTTLVHEIGHFLGLSHPWEMSNFNLNMLGLDDHEAERNHMSYHPEVDNFSAEQLESMQHFALTFRSYIVHRVEHHAVAYTSAFGAP